MNLSFNYSSTPEKAPTLWSKFSFGTAKTRLHFYNYSGEKGKDLYAVYAKKVTPEEGKKTELGIKGRFIYIQGEKPEIVYKVNKASLQKRLGIEDKELEDVKNNDYSTLIQQKLEKKGIKFINQPKEQPEQESLDKPKLDVQPLKTGTLSKKEWVEIYKEYSKLVEDLTNYYSIDPDTDINKFKHAIEVARVRGYNNPELFKQIPKNGQKLLEEQKKLRDRLLALEKKVDGQDRKTLDEKLVAITENVLKMNSHLDPLVTSFEKVLNDDDFKRLTNEDVSKEKIKSAKNLWDGDELLGRFLQEFGALGNTTFQINKNKTTRITFEKWLEAI